MEETIELRELMGIILKRKWLIALVTILCLLLGTGYSLYLVTPEYQSSTTLMVNGSKGINAGDLAASFDLGSINLSQKLVVTYSEIVKSRIVLEQVISQLEIDYTYTELLRMTSAQQVGSTEILKISVTSTDPVEAEQIANTISSVFIKEVMRILKVNNVEIIDAAIPMYKAINMRTTLNIAISAVLGIMLGVFLAFFLEYLDHTIKTEEDVEKYLGVSVIGMIPDYSKEMKSMGV